MQRRLADVAGETVTYNGEPVRAVAASSTLKVNDEYGTSVIVRTFDFIVAVSAIPGEPQKGDEIVRQGRRYVVTSPGGEPCWRYSGTAETTYRIHTKQMPQDADLRASK